MCDLGKTFSCTSLTFRETGRQPWLAVWVARHCPWLCEQNLGTSPFCRHGMLRSAPELGN